MNIWSCNIEHGSIELYVEIFYILKSLFRVIDIQLYTMRNHYVLKILKTYSLDWLGQNLPTHCQIFLNSCLIYLQKNRQKIIDPTTEIIWQLRLRT